MKASGTQVIVVCIADLLRKRHPRFFRQMAQLLDEHHTRLELLQGPKDVWVKDFMPVQRHDGKLVSFTYCPDYLCDGYRHLITDWKKVTPIPKHAEVVDSGLILDGGNVVLQGRTAIFTNKLFTENPQLTRDQIEIRLRESFELEKLIFIPQEQGDIWGHADGMVSWAGPDRLLMNDYRKIDPRFHRELKGILTKAGLDVAEIPYSPDLRPTEIPSAEGTYTNMLILPAVVLVPVYGIPADEKALARIEIAFSDRQVVPISASTLANEGGSIHCVTVEYRREAGTKKAGGLKREGGTRSGENHPARRKTSRTLVEIQEKSSEVTAERHLTGGESGLRISLRV